MSRILYLTTIEFAPGALATLPEALGELGIGRPLLISDSGIAAAGLLDRAGALPAGRHAALPRRAAQPDGGGGGRGARGLSRRELRRRRRHRRRLADRPRQGRGAARHASRPAGDLCGDLWRHAEDRRVGRARRRDPDHRRHGRRGRPRRAAHACRRPEARLHQPASHPEARHLRPGADARPAAGADRRDRARRALALHRDVPLAALQSAGGGDRARRRRPHLAQHRARRRVRLGSRRRAAR